MDFTPRPTIEIPEDPFAEPDPALKEQRRKRIDDIINLPTNGAVEHWFRKHFIRIGPPCKWLTDADYMAECIDPYPYEKEYIFFCMK
jgi:hypothetical protein